MKRNLIDASQLELEDKVVSIKCRTYQGGYDAGKRRQRT